MEPIAGIPHADLLKLVIAFALLLATARLLGELCLRIGIPPVVGEIVAGIVLGPSGLSGLFPAFGRLLIPSTPGQVQLLDLVGVLGVMLLLVVIGMETDLGLIRSRLKISLSVGLGGLVVPLIFGFALGMAIPDDLLPDPSQRGVFGLFLAVALSLSAIPVLAKILGDLGLMRRPFGQTVLAAGMIDDLLGWALLGIVTALAAAGRFDLLAIAQTLGAVLLFVLATLVVARPVARRSLHLVQDRMISRDRVLTLVICLAFGWGALTQSLHLEPILGAFAIGVIFGQTRRMPLEVGRQLESVTYGVFAPIFLATAGLRLDIAKLLEPRLLVLTAAVLLVAAAGKLVGAYLGARWASTTRREGIAYGLALNARGVLGIIVASIGLSMQIFSVEIYSMMVVVSILTSVAAPIGIRLVFGVDEPGSDTPDGEGGMLGDIRRVLVPVRLRTEGESGAQALEAAALARIAGKGLAVTLLSGVARGDRKEGGRYLDQLAGLFPTGTEIATKLVAPGDVGRAILREIDTGYDMVAMGATERGEHGEHFYSSIVDEVVRLAPCPTLVFSAGAGQWPPRRILVPTGGSPWARRAAELAFTLAGQDGEVVIFHVVDQSLTTRMATGVPSLPAVRLGIGQEVVEDLRSVGEGFGARVLSEVRLGGETTESILARLDEGDIDLMILGTAVRAGSQRLYLGPKVERLLSTAGCSVIVLNI
ncbi:MAG: cation:proton antiporter [Acidimicrobiia bacterium]